MRRIALVLIAAISLTLAFSACNDNGTVKDIPVDEIMSKVIEDTDLDTNMIVQSENQVIVSYGINLSLLEEHSVKISKNIVSANTIAIFKLKDVKDIVAFQNSVNKRKNDMIDLFQDYAPAESDLAMNSIAMTKGRYILFVVSKDAEKVKAAFEKMFK